MYQHEARSRLPSRVIFLVAALAFPFGSLCAATDEVAELRREIQALQAEYLERLNSLERRLEALETNAPTITEPGEPSDDLARIRAAAAATLAAPGAVAPQAPGAVAAGSLNRLNPEISVTGNVLATASDTRRDEFALQEFELDIQSALDPYSRMRLTVALGEDEIEIEEAFIVYPNLPGGLSLTAGKFRQQFGYLNRQHLHALPQTQYPLALAAIFGEEGLAQTGVSLRWLLPKPWASANEVTFEVTDGENDAFGGESFADPTLLAHLENYWELSEATYLAWGLSGIVGDNGAGGDSSVVGTDITLHWQPPSRAKYREVTWRTELFRSERDIAGLSVAREAWAGFTYFEALIRRNLSVGLRYDTAENALAPLESSWAITPYLTWWQSEFVRLRSEAQYRVEDGALGTRTDETRFAIQLTWAAGPHKHETY